jgi:hypothetical protein
MLFSQGDPWQRNGRVFTQTAPRRPRRATWSSKPSRLKGPRSAVRLARVVVALLLTACNDESVLPRSHRTNDWKIAYSPNMPASMSGTEGNWYFDFPTQNGVHYVYKLAPAIKVGQTITMHFAITGNGNLVPTEGSATLEGSWASRKRWGDPVHPSLTSFASMLAPPPLPARIGPCDIAASPARRHGGRTMHRPLTATAIRARCCSITPGIRPPKLAICSVAVSRSMTTGLATA